MKYVKTYPAKSGSDLSAKAGYAAQYDAGVALATAKAISGGQEMVGIIAQGGGNTSTLPVSVVVAGPTLAVAGAAVAAHKFLTCDGSGKLIEAAAGEKVIARALEAAGADGDLFEVLVGVWDYTLDTDT